MKFYGSYEIRQVKYTISGIVFLSKKGTDEQFHNKENPSSPFNQTLNHVMIKHMNFSMAILQL